MNRRKFLKSTGVVAAGELLRSRGSAYGENSVRQISLRVDPEKVLAKIEPDFLGLGYEISSVATPGLLSASNPRYVQYVKSLGAHGVIRVGGNTSDFSSYQLDGHTSTSPTAVVVNRASIRDLASFLDATGWCLIWGLNLGGGTLENAMEEAKAIAEITGDKLSAIEIGNEPDLFPGTVAHRPKGYSYEDYLKEYRRFKDALRSKMPHLAFAGPDVATRTDWVTRFAKDEGADLRMLTHHYYAEGPPQSPASTMERLLHADVKLDRMLEECRAAGNQAKIPYRICETNSCFGGGKPSVSDTFAASLWGLDYLFTLAEHNAGGVNIETGVNQLGFISSYSPIGDDEKGNYSAQPLYYGMLAFASIGHGALVQAEYEAGGMNLAAYAVKGSEGRRFVCVINKEPSIGAVVSVEIPGAKEQGEVLRLTGLSLNAKSGVTLGGAHVDAEGNWEATQKEVVTLRQGACELKVPAASAAILAS